LANNEIKLLNEIKALAKKNQHVSMISEQKNIIILPKYQNINMKTDIGTSENLIKRLSKIKESNKLILCYDKLAQSHINETINS